MDSSREQLSCGERKLSPLYSLAVGQLWSVCQGPSGMKWYSGKIPKLEKDFPNHHVHLCPQDYLSTAAKTEACLIIEGVFVS